MSGVVHATVPCHHNSVPRPGRHRTPPFRTWRVSSHVIDRIALTSIHQAAPIACAACRIIVIAFDLWGLRTRKGVFPLPFPLLNPVNGWTDEPGQRREMSIRERQDLGLDAANCR